MQAMAPPLLPLLRSRLQAELLTLVLLSPGHEWSLTELAQRVGASVATAQREVARAEQTGVISSRRLGSTRLVTAATSPLTEPLTELLLRSFGPRQVLAEELAGVAGIDQAYLYGSWAARYAGQAGRAPSDIDVLVIGTPDRDQLDETLQRATERLAREVNATIRSRSWWDGGTDGFHTEVTARPLVPIHDHTTAVSQTRVAAPATTPRGQDTTSTAAAATSTPEAPTSTMPAKRAARRRPTS